MNIVNYNIKKYRLKNGIKVILNKNINNYSIACNFFFHVGSKNDFIKNRGLANFFKYYIIFNKKTFEKKIKNLGAILNAFVTHDGTYFNIIIIKHQLELILNLMSQNFKNLLFNKKNILKIINFINKEKYNNNNNNNINNFYNNLIYKIIPKYLFKKHLYKNPIIGKVKELKKCLIKNYKKFYKKYFISNNMVISISGNISFNKTKKYINKYFSKFYKKKLFIPKSVKESKLKNNVVYFKNKYINFFIGILLYRLPSILNKDIYLIKFIKYYFMNKYENYLLKIIKKKK